MLILLFQVYKPIGGFSTTCPSVRDDIYFKVGESVTQDVKYSSGSNVTVRRTVEKIRNSLIEQVENVVLHSSTIVDSPWSYSYVTNFSSSGVYVIKHFAENPLNKGNPEVLVCEIRVQQVITKATLTIHTDTSPHQATLEKEEGSDTKSVTVKVEVTDFDGTNVSMTLEFLDGHGLEVREKYYLYPPFMISISFFPI